MTDYGHDLLFGSFLTPTADRPDHVVGLAQLSEQVGLDLVTFQDHPYQPAHLDAWTLLSYVAAATLRIRLSPNVLNLPLRQPTVIARSVASLDRLSNGRVELGLGAGAFWEAIEANGGRRLTPGQSVAALGEAIGIIREVWDDDQRGGVRFDGDHYRVVGAKRGPAPAHDVGIWVGGYKPRMLELVGRTADGWLPSLTYLPEGAAALADLNARIDEAADAGGRDPRAVRRLLNVPGEFDGNAEQWADSLTELAVVHGFSGFILASDDPSTIQRFGDEVAPATREMVAAERAGVRPIPVAVERRPEETSTVSQARNGPTSTPPPQVRTGTRQVWDESTRPQGPPPPADHAYTDQARAAGQHLVDVHDHLRRELSQLRTLLDQVRDGALTASDARGALNEMTLRRNDWTLGAYCAQYCSLLTQHHTLEDQAVFPHLRASDAALEPVIERLEQEHHVIHEVVLGVDRALVEHMSSDGDFGPLQDAVDVLTDALLSHLSYEEHQIVEPIARFGFFPGQL